MYWQNINESICPFCSELGDFSPQGVLENLHYPILPFSVVKKAKSQGILFCRGFCYSTSPILIFTLAKLAVLIRDIRSPSEDIALSLFYRCVTEAPLSPMRGNGIIKRSRGTEHRANTREIETYLLFPSLSPFFGTNIREIDPFLLFSSFLRQSSYLRNDHRRPGLN